MKNTLFYIYCALIIILVLGTIIPNLFSRIGIEFILIALGGLFFTLIILFISLIKNKKNDATSFFKFISGLIAIGIVINIISLTVYENKDQLYLLFLDYIIMFAWFISISFGIVGLFIKNPTKE